MTGEWTDDQRRRLRQEEIIGVIPATVASVQGPRIHVGIVFATNVTIIARLMRFKDIYFAEKTAGGRYYALQREWSYCLHKAAETILESKNYQCYIIPHANITHVSAAEKGRFQKRCSIIIHTPEQEYWFDTVTDEKTVAKDLTGFLRQAGVKFSPGGMM